MYEGWKTYVQGMESISLISECGIYMKLTNKGKERTYFNANHDISKYLSHPMAGQQHSHSCFH